MRIFYNSETGEIVGSIEGFSTDPRLDKMRPVIDGVDIDVLNITLDHPQANLAKQMEDPSSGVSMWDHKIDMNNKVVRPLTKEEHNQRESDRAVQAKAAAEWRKNNPPRDPLAEIDALKAQLAKLQQNPPTKT